MIQLKRGAFVHAGIRTAITLSSSPHPVYSMLHYDLSVPTLTKTGVMFQSYVIAEQRNETEKFFACF
jgi:hypothetical protein